MVEQAWQEGGRLSPFEVCWNRTSGESPSQTGHGLEPGSPLPFRTASPASHPSSPYHPVFLRPCKGLLFSISWVIVCVTWSSTWVDYQRKGCLGWRHLDLTVLSWKYSWKHHLLYWHLKKCSGAGMPFALLFISLMRLNYIVGLPGSSLDTWALLGCSGQWNTVFCVCLAHGDSSPVLPLTDNSALWHQRYLVIDFIIYDHTEILFWFVFKNWFIFNWG